MRHVRRDGIDNLKKAVKDGMSEDEESRLADRVQKLPDETVTEIDKLLAERRLSWRTRVDFLYRNFRPYLLANINPADASFIDGSVLNNKPFAKAIEARNHAQALLEVERRRDYFNGRSA